MDKNKMMRSGSDRMFGGVCAGLAKYFGWTPTNFRLFYVLLSVLSAAFPGILVYVVLWVLLPLEK